MQHQPLGDEIHGDVSDGKSAAIGKGINQHEQNVNVNFPPPWNPAQGHGQGEGLSVAAEQRIDAEIGKLRQDVTELNGSVIALTYQLKNETESRQMRTESQERIINAFVETIRGQIATVLNRMAEVEATAAIEARASRELAARMESMRGKRDPLTVVFASMITVVLIVIAWILIAQGGL